MSYRVRRYIAFLTLLAGVHLWLVITGRPSSSQAERLYVLGGCDGPTWSIAFSPGGEFLAAGGQDKTVKIWDMSTGRLRRTLKGHTDAVNSVAFSPGGRTLASGSADGTVKLWDVASGRLLRSLRQVTGPVAFSPDGRLLADTDGEAVKLWDTRSWRLVAILPGPRVPLEPPLQTSVGVGQIAFAPDGKSLATVERVQSGSGLSPPEDFVQLWDTATWRVRQRLREPLWEQKSIAFAPDSRRLAVAGGWINRGDVLLWDFADEKVRSLASEQETEASSVAYDPRGRWVAFANGGDASFVDVRSGKEILSVKPKGAFQEIAISPNSALLAATPSDLLYGSGVEVWRLPASLRLGSVLARVDAAAIRLGVMPAHPGNGSMHP